MSDDRRQFLRAIGAGCIGTVAGCASITGDDPGEGTPATATESGATRVITMEAAGADIWNTVDHGHFYYAQVTGDFDVTVQVASLANTNPHAKAGIMVRESLEGPSRNVMLRRRAGFESSLQWREEDGGESTSTTSEDGAAFSEVPSGTVEGDWLRLQRTDGTITASASTDGEDWTTIAELPADLVGLSDEVYLGLAATSHSRGEATTAKFRNLGGLSPTENEDLGTPFVEGSVSVTEAAVLSAADPSDVTADGATLRANLEALGGTDSLDVSFEYREVGRDEWQTADAGSVSEPGTVSATVSGLTPRRYYRYRAVADDGETTTTTVADVFGTPSGGDGSDATGPDSASAFDPDDGFADVAPWLDDDTPLVVVREATREALERAVGVPGPRVVVFETSGTIDLGASDLNVRNDACWIAGQTAPSPGITLIRGGLWVYGDDCVVQHLRVRPGIAGQEEGWQPDAINTADGTANNVVDHCTGTWGIDENVNTGYDTTDTTISNCLVAEPLNDATHQKGPHGYNTIVGDRSKNVTLAGNVWALGTDRNPRLKEGTETVVVNNLLHYYHDGMWADPNTRHSIVGNVFERPQTDQPNVYGEGDVYAADNVPDPDADVPMLGDGIRTLTERPLWPDELTAIDAGETKSHDLANAGARPADRTAHDERIVERIRAGDGGTIDSQEEVGGYPDLPENVEPIDEPDSGLRAWLREQAVAVEE